LPFEGYLDITYRCNNNCRHCWLRVPSSSQQKLRELSFDEIKSIVDEARKMGCRKWHISGGEPMLRHDFAEIFDYITKKAVTYSLNTNGTLITPRISQLLKRKGSKMVAIYGATAEVHDHITRNPGSYESTMQGISYLREAGAGFTVQVVPMKDNYHQLDDMVNLAESLSRHWRIGASWLYLSGHDDLERNQEIIRQRLTPEDTIKLDMPNPFPCDAIVEAQNEEDGKVEDSLKDYHQEDDSLFAGCIANKRDFHIDPYGQMTFCSFVKDPALRYDLRKGSFIECWEEFIPSLTDIVRGGQEYSKNCGSCELRSDCKWCPVYGYLEHQKFSAKVEYLCAVAKENRKFKMNWQNDHRRYFQIAGIIIQVDFDLPVSDSNFDPKFKCFEADGPSEDMIIMNHHFFIPDLNDQDLGKEVIRNVPWAVYRKDDSWIYTLISDSPDNIYQMAIFNNEHNKADIYNERERAKRMLKSGIASLSMFPTDQLFLVQALANRDACLMHSAGVSLDNNGFIFVGHSEAGKSTMVKMLRDKAKILCDDRTIIRKWADEFRVHGTWSHGEVPDVSAGSAPLKAILFLEKSEKNYLTPIDNKNEAIKRILTYMIKSLEDSDWWDKSLSIIEEIAYSVPCYMLHFDKSGHVIDLLEKI